ncbi:MAG: ABC transporter ATP-binding protein [Pseudomonadota bacterium]
MAKQLELDHVSVRYGQYTAAREVSFALEAGEIGCLLGPSGCGKTTLLRAIAGFEPLFAGQIKLHEKIISNQGMTLAPESRRVGMVFQDFALFPHLTVSQNIGFGLQGLDRRNRSARITQMQELVDLEAQGDRYPHELSGGQQQRVALARALAPEPELLLMDEPFSSLDTELREQLAREVRDLLKANSVTAILVTHNQREALAMADQIALIKEGRIVQSGSPSTVYRQPLNAFVARFIGQGAIVELRLGEHSLLEEHLGLTELAAQDLSELKRVRLLIRPEHVIYTPESTLQLPILNREFQGACYRYELVLPDRQTLQCLVPSELELPPGATLPVRFDRQQLVQLRDDLAS